METSLNTKRCELGGGGVRTIEQIARRTIDLAQGKLHNCGYAALGRLRCRYYEGVLSIRGKVPSYYLKQVAYTLLRDVEGVEEYSDQIEVAAQRRRPVATDA